MRTQIGEPLNVYAVHGRAGCMRGAARWTREHLGKAGGQGNSSTLRRCMQRRMDDTSAGTAWRSVASCGALHHRSRRRESLTPRLRLLNCHESRRVAPLAPAHWAARTSALHEFLHSATQAERMPAWIHSNEGDTRHAADRCPAAPALGRSARHLWQRAGWGARPRQLAANGEPLISCNIGGGVIPQRPGVSAGSVGLA